MWEETLITNPVLVALDTQTIKIWNKIPSQQRSKTIRALLLGLEDKEQEKKSVIVPPLSVILETPAGAQKQSLEREKHLNEMAHILSEKKNKRSKTPEADIQKLLRQASG